MNMNWIPKILIMLGMAVCPTLQAKEEGVSPGAVMLDIGHQPTAKGAQSPDKKINEFDFWIKYAPFVRAEVESAGYRCIVTNRANAPKNHVGGDIVYMNKPDKNGKRYPSTHHPEHIGAGMICADYAIDIKARCVVFLHLNSTGNKWATKPATGLIIYNKNNGKSFAEQLCQTMRSDILDSPGGLSNGNKGIKAIPRFIGSQPSAGWMNTLDEENIPAIVFEALYVNNKKHAEYLQNDKNARKLAQTIGKSIVLWLRASGKNGGERRCVPRQR